MAFLRANGGRAALPRVFRIVVLAGLSSCASISHSDNLDFQFLAFGDSGYIADAPDESGLTAVSDAMRDFCETTDCDFAVMAGDNIYPDGADGDPDSAADAVRFKQVFKEPFGNLAGGERDFRIYVTLGNHDWRTSRAGAFAQIDFHEKTRPFYMNGPFYSVRPPAGNGEIELFVIDTEMLLSTVTLDDAKIADDGSIVLTGQKEKGGSEKALPQGADEANQLEWFERALKDSTAPWKIVLAHHPLWESKGTKFKQAEALREMLLPMLCRYADAYIAGHQHTLEIHEAGCADALPDEAVQPLAHIVSGAASKQRSVNPEFMAWQSEQYPELNNLWAQGSVWGFAHIAINDDDLHVRMFTLPEGEGDFTAYRESFSYHFSNRGEVKP